MKLANRIFFSLIGIIIISSLASAFVGAVLISRALKEEAFSRVSYDLKEARLYFDDLLDELTLYARLHANGLEDRIALSLQPNLSVLITPASGEGERAGKFVDLLESHSGLSFRTPGKGFVSIPLRLLSLAGFPTEDLGLKVRCDGESTIWLYAVALGDEGISFSGVLLNGNNRLTVELQEVLFGKALYGSKPFGTVTVFCGDKRVATTVIGPSGIIAVGTRVSEVVRRKVLEEGGVWLDRAFVVDDWYLSAYEPIQNPRGENIGILYVGVLEKRYLDIRNRVVLILSAIVIPTLGLLIFSVFIISRNIVKPIASLAAASEKIAGGQLDTEIPYQGRVIDSELETLLTSFDKMVSAIKGREKMLLKKNTQLEETNKDYQELLSFVTHELNNSIGSLLLNVSLLNDGTLGELDAERNEVAGQILRDVQRFRDMVRNYLNISRLEKGTLRYNPATVNVKTAVVEPVLRRLESRIRHRGLKLLWDWPEEAVLAVDTELLDICYSNLLVNTLKYGRDWVRLSAERRVDGWVFGVANGGVPIPREKIPLLFRKFSRLVKSDDGAGLGLYLVQKIMERHGGEVWCDSSAEATTFYMKIPSSS